MFDDAIIATRVSRFLNLLLSSHSIPFVFKKLSCHKGLCIHRY